MTLVAIPAQGLLYPFGSQVLPVVSAAGTIDASTEKVAMIGRLFILGRPGAAKTLSAAGGGSISFNAGAVTFANAGTSIDIGIQGVNAVNGPVVRPDGTFSVKRTLVGGTDTITANALNTFALTGGTGSKSIAHGDLIAIVLDMTARAGADSVIVNGTSVGGGTLGVAANPYTPVTNSFFSSAWQSTGGVVPIALIVFDDGTLAYLDNTSFYTSTINDTWSDATNPDERGVIFQVPWDCKIDALWAAAGGNSNTSDYDIKLYSDPLGTPSALASLSILAEQGGAAFVTSFIPFLLFSEISLSRNTDYAVALKATGAGTVRLFSETLADTAHRALWPGGTTLRKATRDNSTGVFTEESPAVTRYMMGVRISQIHDGAGGGGLLTHPGLSGGFVQ